MARIYVFVEIKEQYIRFTLHKKKKIRRYFFNQFSQNKNFTGDLALKYLRNYSKYDIIKGIRQD